MNNREKLMDLIVAHGLERREIADLVRVKRDTVDRWLAPHQSKHSEEMPDMAIELLELKLKQRT
jgi:transposase